jgi:hypothetical protein
MRVINMGKSKIYDKVKLIVTAIAIMGGSLLSIIIMKDYSMSEKWIFFIISDVIYFLLLLWMTFVDKILKGIPRFKILMFQLSYFILTTIIMVLVIRTGLIPTPNSFFLYMGGILILLLFSFYLLNIFFNKKSQV